jgi:hypothetical protein
MSLKMWDNGEIHPGISYFQNPSRYFLLSESLRIDEFVLPSSRNIAKEN